MVRPGVTTRQLDQHAERLIRRAGARSAFKNYQVGDHVFPAVLCTSINEQIVHGIPSDRPLQEGDIVGLDFGVEYGGYYGDSAITVPVGSIAPQSPPLLAVPP